MRNPTVNHPFTVEFAIVIILAFGYPSYHSILTVITVFQTASLNTMVVSTDFTSDGLLWVVKYEIVIFLVIASYLWLRGWKTYHFQIYSSLKSTLAGFGLFVAGHLCYYVVCIFLYPLIMRFYSDGIENMFHVSASLPTIVALSVVNPVFEEVFVLGYVIKALEGRTSVYTALNISIGIRLLYHLYQGPIAIASILPIGILFGWFYSKYRNLWPPIFAHGLMDFISLTFSDAA